MKKFLLSAALITGSLSAFCSVSVHYENKDEKGYNMRVAIDGTEKVIHFEITNADIVIQGGNNVCVIETKCGKVEVSDGDHIVIQDGCVKVHK